MSGNLKVVTAIKTRGNETGVCWDIDRHNLGKNLRRHLSSSGFERLLLDRINNLEFLVLLITFLIVSVLIN